MPSGCTRPSKPGDFLDGERAALFPPTSLAATHRGVTEIWEMHPPNTRVCSWTCHCLLSQGRAEGSLCLPLPSLGGRFEGFALRPALTALLPKANPTGNWRSPHTPGGLLWLLLPRCCRGLTSNETQLTGFCWGLHTRGPALLLLKSKEVSAVRLENQNQTLKRNVAMPSLVASEANRNTPVVFAASWAK